MKKLILVLCLPLLLCGCGKEEQKEVDPVVGTWQYGEDDLVSTYEFKEDGTLWINGTYIDKYENGSAICDNCLTHIGTDEIKYKVYNDELLINFHKELEEKYCYGEECSEQGSIETEEVWVIDLGGYVKATRVE